MINTQAKDINPAQTRLESQNKVLWDLAISQRHKKDDFLTDLQRITKTAAEYLEVQRVSVWLYSKQRTALECATLYDNSTDSFSNGFVLEAEDYPIYFKACDSQKFIDAPDAMKNPCTVEFAKDYLPTHGITSMLDSSIYMGSHPQGIVCFEHTGPKRNWLEEDRTFVASIGDLVALEIAERQRSEASDFIKSGLETVAQAILICANDGSVVRVNRFAEKVFGYSRKDLLKLTIDELLPGVMSPSTGVVRHALEGNRVPKEIVENHVGINRSGQKFSVEFSISYLSHWKKKHVLIILSDISERHARSLELKRSESLYRSVVEDQVDLIIRVEKGGRIIFANKASSEYFKLSLSELTAHNVYDFVPDEDHKIIREGMASLALDRPVVNYTHRIKLPDESIRTISWTLRGFFNNFDEVVGYQVIGRDISEELKKESQLRESQRLESLAVLAGGMAHDFNNLLTPILAYTDLVQTSLPRDREELKYLSRVMESAVRARDLTRKVLIFSRREEVKDRHSLYAGQLIREIIDFIRSTISSRIKLVTEVDNDCGVITANPSDIYQIISNLSTNAAQAMPAGGELSIICSQVTIDNSSQLQIEVSDSGHGINPECLSKIFDPFYTTKPIGKGTGLGLSIAHSLVEELGGKIDCKSELGKGTSFVIHLPSIDTTPDAESTTALTRITGSEHILVVDDELFVAAALRDGLEELGYSVVMRSSASEALIAFKQSPEQFDAVITDFIMPYMTGVELTWQLKRVRPDIPVIMTSGYGQLLTEEEINTGGISACVNKPFLLQEIASALRKALQKK